MGGLWRVATRFRWVKTQACRQWVSCTRDSLFAELACETVFRRTHFRQSRIHLFVREAGHLESRVPVKRPTSLCKTRAASVLS